MKKLFLLIIIIIVLGTIILGIKNVPIGKPEIIGWFAAWDSEKAQTELPPIIKRFSIFSPMLYRVMEDSSFGRHEISNRDELVGIARKNNIPVVPAITDEGDKKRIHTLLYDNKVQIKFIDAMLVEAKREQYSGYGIDIEYITSKDREAFSKFIIHLSEKLHSNNLQLAVAVYGRDAHETYDPALAHDYKVIGKYADFVELMTYGYNSEESTTPGGETPLKWYRGALQYAVDTVPSEKIVVGLSTHGNDWGVGKAEGLTYPEVKVRLATISAKISYDKDQLAMQAKYKKDGDNHTLYFENAQTILEKIKIAREEFNINTFAFWRLTAEDPELWKNL